jgi:hypothetical protein
MAKFGLSNYADKDKWKLSMQSLSNIASHTAFSVSYQHQVASTAVLLLHGYLFKLSVFKLLRPLSQPQPLPAMRIKSLDNRYLSCPYPPSSPCLSSVAGFQSLSSTSTATS